MDPVVREADATPLLWAKAEDGDYHPLLGHMLDAAAVAEAVWTGGLNLRMQRRIASGLGLGGEDAGAWVPFIAGLHDLGKACQAFQSKVPLLATRLRERGVPWGALAQGPRHGLVTAATLAEALGAGELGAATPDPQTAGSLGQVLGAHHGLFPTAADVDRARSDLARAERGSTAWRRMRGELVRRLAARCGVMGAAAPWIDPFAPDNPSAILLAGLTVIADWIASNPEYFPFRPALTDQDEYWASARKQAEQALSRLGWGAWRPPMEARAFAELFPHLADHPRPVQTRAADLEPAASPPRLVIIEVPMGEGKTEAAMLLQDRWAALLRQRGAYFALPTMATSNQMFTRVERFPTPVGMNRSHALTRAGRTCAPHARGDGPIGHTPNVSLTPCSPRPWG